MKTEIQKIIQNIEQVSIREIVGLKNQNKNENLKSSHYRITVVEKLQENALELGYDFCTKNNFIYFFDGQYWHSISEEEMTATLGYSASKMGIDKYTSHCYLFKESLTKQFQSSSTFLNENPKDFIKINLLNGTYVFGEEGGLRDFDKNDFLTYQLPFEYNPDAKAPLFYEYLNRVLPDKDCQNILAEYLGYVFTNNHKHEKCLLLYGSGANGKSVFFQISKALLGNENVTSYTLKNLNDENCRAQIYNKLLNYASEIDANISHDIFKQLCSGEPLQARFKYKNVFMMDNYAKLCFNCNELPKDNEHTHAYFRRFIIIPFTETIPEKEQNKDLASSIIKNELSGIFNWVLAGLKRLEDKGGFSESKAVSEALNGFKEEGDSVYQFLIEENLEKSREKSILQMELYQGYSRFCSDNGFRPLNRNNFRRRLEARTVLFKRDSSGIRVFLNKKSENRNSISVEVVPSINEDSEELPF